ncbi:hypothetical protein JYK14_04315 [Siccirubricoccus sp. KC 17139]|uniref:DUF3618 domain-containing protein n=1 Tax=Siccirubricoccus soli TaxID=2899147 RepID=A0ABT1D0G8_9PROT|nr:hypothetical protein [Siccirubricoccus soli]MCO6415401.1 hypothetical protein [Siccirubricoccus soli]MCP2681533.1 hypothetical protein [Siccirubricoccus soli]
MADGYFSALRERAHDVRDSAESYGRRARRELHDRSDDTRGELARLWGQLEDLVERRVAPAASEAAGNARVYAREGRDAALYLADHIRDATRARPLVAIGVAVAATWLIGSLLRGKR